MDLLWNGLSWACLLAGGGFVITGALGLLRMPDLFTRLHGAGIIDTLGAGLILVGLMIQSGLSLTTVKLLLLLFLILFTTPTASHALAKAAIHGRLLPEAENKEKLSSPP